MAEIIKAGAINVEEFTLITESGQTFDLKTYITELSIYEDMFSNCLSGSAIFVDGSNLVAQIPIIGREIITIRVNNPGFPNSIIHRSFYIYAIQDRAPSSTDRQQIYTLKFISLEGMIDNITFISKKYSGTTDAIAKSIFNDYLQMPRIWNKKYPFPKGISSNDGLTTPSWRTDIPRKNLSVLNTGPASLTPFKTKVTCVVPLWNPFKVLNWLANRSIDASNNSPSVLFWESTQSFYFGSIESIFTAQSNVKERKMYFYGLDNAAIKEIEKGKNTLGEQFKKVEELKITKNTDVLNAQDMGHYSSNMHVMDIATRNYDFYIFDYASNYSSFKHLDGERPTFSTNQIRNVYSYPVFKPKHKGLFDITEENKYEDWVLQRNSIMYDLNNIRVEITVPGFCGTEAGEVVQLYFPNIAEKNNVKDITQLIDPHLSGPYLVTAIRHLILDNKYYMRMELIKESFATSLG
jgi:hypothetical protein